MITMVVKGALLKNPEYKTDRPLATSESRNDFIYTHPGYIVHLTVCHTDPETRSHARRNDSTPCMVLNTDRMANYIDYSSHFWQKRAGIVYQLGLPFGDVASH